MNEKHHGNLPRIAVHPKTKRVIQTIALIRGQTQTDVVEEYLRRSGIQEECEALKKKNGWIRTVE